MGDPSIHPVEMDSPHTGIPVTPVTKKLAPKAFKLSVGRTNRRSHLISRGSALSLAAMFAKKLTKPKLTMGVHKGLKKLAREASITSPEIMTFRVNEAKVKKGVTHKEVALVKGMPVAKSAYHVIMPPPPKKKAKVVPIEVIIALEENGKLVSYRKMYRH
jgi:hypothetical protein